MTCALLILPHQLFGDHPGLRLRPERVVLVEDPLFFGDPRYFARFHKQKLWLHRATMERYRTSLEGRGHQVELEHYRQDTALVADLIQRLVQSGTNRIVVADPVDQIASQRLRRAAAQAGTELEVLESPGFLNTSTENADQAKDQPRWFMAEFYKRQRRRLNVLMDGDQPQGYQWSFDEDNRKKVPKKRLGSIPPMPILARDAVDEAAKLSVLRDFPDAPGRIDQLYYPTSHQDAAQWLQRFLEDRFHSFGDYEDAIVEGENWLWHSVLTPALNIGLLTPQQVLNAALDYADQHDVPMNALEGFVRQIIGWREFMRATYDHLGTRMRTTNHWGHKRKLPQSFYDGSTGIDPVDDVIRRVLDTGYCHHIERLMVLGGFMFLCEFDPDDVYRWFMEMFVDSYDWVMVPNVYAMSQFADGGLITTKPYFSGSNYIKKMSHWKDGEWAKTWDGLYWRFIWKNRQALGKNHRWNMMMRLVSRMEDAKREAHLERAEAFLAKL